METFGHMEVPFWAFGPVVPIFGSFGQVRTGPVDHERYLFVPFFNVNMQHLDEEQPKEDKRTPQNIVNCMPTRTATTDDADNECSICQCNLSEGGRGKMGDMC